MLCRLDDDDETRKVIEKNNHSRPTENQELRNAIINGHVRTTRCCVLKNS